MPKVTPKPPLQEHQKRGVQFLLEHSHALLGDEPGLGKSRQLIEASRGDTLVVAPAMVISGGTWDDEIARWSINPSRFVQVPYTSLNARDGRKVTDRLRPEYNRKWDTVILDEAHYVKNRKTTWTPLLVDLARRSDSVYQATGTPIANWAHELFTLLQIMHPDESKRGQRFGAYWRWVHEWFVVQPSYFNPKAQEIGSLKACGASCSYADPLHPCDHYTQFVEANLGDRFLRRLRDECLDLPPVTEQWIRTPMSPATRREYRKMKSDYLAEIDGQQVVAWSSGSRNVLLDQLTIAPALASPDFDPSNPKHLTGGKLDQLREDLSNRNRPTLVLAHYRKTVDACAAVARQLGLSTGVVRGGESGSGEAVRRFKSGKLDVLVGSLETLAEGLTLTQADTVIFVERSYKPFKNTQAMRRIHRIGQTRPVTVRHYLTPESWDEGKQTLLDAKADHQLRVLSAAQFAQLA